MRGVAPPHPDVTYPHLTRSDAPGAVAAGQRNWKLQWDMHGLVRLHAEILPKRPEVGTGPKSYWYSTTKFLGWTAGSMPISEHGMWHMMP